jgi:hypothetical protein
MEKTSKVVSDSPAVMYGGIKKKEFDAAVANIKGRLDTIGNTQQMDLLRLQTLLNRRNEAIDLASMTIKKHADKNEAIIGNMR